MSQFERPNPTITVERVTEADLKEALMGSQSDPTYAEQFGITSAPLGTTGYKPQSIAELELEAAKAMARMQAEAAASLEANRPADPFASEGDTEKFRKLYGQSENEKGQLRKAQAEIMEAFNGLMAQHEALQAQVQQQQQYGGYQAPQAPNYGQPQYGGGGYVDPFAGIGDDDVVQGKQIKELIERSVAPAIGSLLQRDQQNAARMAALEAQIVRQTKEASGLNAVDEFRLTAKNPWLRELPAPQRVKALASLRQAELVNAPAPSPATIPAPTDAQQRVLNKLTYVENGNAQVSDTSEAALEAAKMRDYAKAMASASDTGERAKMLRAWASKYGVQTIGQPPSDIAH